MKQSAAAGGLARLQGALPLLIVYFALAALYSWQASRRPVPTIFVDELELTQLARAIADTGEPARRGEPYGWATLTAYFLAPAWWLGSASAAYATAKLMLVLAMTATLFPAYALARLVVSPRYALAAAVGATVVPALAYSPILVEEPLAYPLSTVALWLIARVLVEPRWSRVALALVISGLAVWTRTQLAVLFAVLGLALLWLAWDSERGRRWRSTWSRWDWAGAVVLAVGAVLGFSALMGHASTSWRETTGFYKERLIENATWATGALAIGIGIIPLLIGVSALARPKDEPRDRQTQAFVVTSVLALVSFIWYAAIKGAYLSTTFSTLVVERNVMYLTPILFAATALAFARGVGRGWAVAGVAVATVYLVVATPLRLDSWPYYDAHGLSAAAFMNRVLGWPEGRIEGTLIAVCVLGVGVAVALTVLKRGSTAFRAVAAAAAVGVLAWSLTTEVYAAESERDLSLRTAKNFLEPYDWVERATGGGSVVVLGQGISDATGIQLTEFFNPSVRKLWSLDGSATKVGAPFLTPDLEASDGTLTPNPGVQYVLSVNGVELQAPVVARQGRDVLYRVDGQQVKLAEAIIGQSPDGWLLGSSDDPVARGSYTRYDVSRDGPGFVIVKLSRLGWCPKPPGSTRATVRIGAVGVGADKQPAIVSLIDEKRVIVHDCTTEPVTFPLPDVPWRAEIAIAPTVRPRDVDPSSSEGRLLGATLEVDVQPLFEQG